MESLTSYYSPFFAPLCDKATSRRDRERRFQLLEMQEMRILRRVIIMESSSGGAVLHLHSFMPHLYLWREEGYIYPLLS